MKSKWKEWLPYSGIPVLGVVLAVFQWERLDPVEFLLRLLLTVFGYVAAVEDLRKKRVPNSLVTAMLGAWILVILPSLFLRMEEILPLLRSGMFGFLLAGFIFLTVYLGLV